MSVSRSLSALFSTIGTPAQVSRRKMVSSILHPTSLVSQLSEMVGTPVGTPGKYLVVRVKCLSSTPRNKADFE